MALPRRIKPVTDDRRDLISELPAEVKDKILECLPTRDAARTALLSTQWNDVWLKHGRLAFDYNFFENVPKCHDDEGRTLVNIINNIFSLRAGPVKKFTLEIYNDDHRPQGPQQSDFDKLCDFLSRNGVEEIDICLYPCKLPFSIVSCQTIKQLRLEGLCIDLPVNAGYIFPNVSSLYFVDVNFKCSVKGIASSISIPNLEKLTFEDCYRVNIFDITSPKLEILSVVGYMSKLCEWRWLTIHLKAIKTLWLSGSALKHMDVSMFPTTINLQVLKLYGLRLGSKKQLTVAKQLLKKSPNLCELWIMEKKKYGDAYDEVASRLLEDPDACFIFQDLKMLKTIKIELVSGSIVEMLFVKMLLSKSPALESVVIVEPRLRDDSKLIEILKKLLCLPRASPKAQIVCMNHHHAFMHKDWGVTHGVRLLGT